MNIDLELTVNKQKRRVQVAPMARLIDVLRGELQLTGTKEGCGEGECGACSVLMDGRLVNSCLVPAVQAEGCRVETIESLARADGELHPLQESFWQLGGAQCGICTPGMIMAAHYLLQHTPQPSEAEVREALAGNLCRCTGYTAIFAAVQDAAARLAKESTGEQP